MGSRTRCGPSDPSSAARGSPTSQPGRFGPRIAAALDEDDLLAITGNGGTGPRTSSWAPAPGAPRGHVQASQQRLPGHELLDILYGILDGFSSGSKTMPTNFALVQQAFVNYFLF